MSVTIIEDLRAKRKGQLDEQRAIVAAAEAEGRDLTAEESGEFEKRQAEFDSLTGRIERLEKLEGFVADASPANPAKRESLPTDISADPAEQDAIETRAFEKLIRKKGDMSSFTKEERAAMQVNTDTEGGFTVPKAFANQLLESMREWGVISDLATHITTAESGTLTLPKVNANSTAAWLDEEAGFTESEPTVAAVTLGAFKAGNYAKISDELLHDSAFDILGFLAKNLGEGIGQLTGAAYATGASGSTTTPEGLLIKASVGRSTAANTGFTAGDLFSLYHSVIEPYRSSAVWLFNDSSVALIRAFTEAVNGQYLWQPGLQAGTPDLLLGKPVYTDKNVSANAANTVVGGFGDVKKAYIIRDVEGIRTKVLNELFALNGQVGVRCDLRTDGDVYDTAAFKTLKVIA